MITMASPVDADALRLRHEYLSAPTLCLTVAQVARLLSIRPEHAIAILITLEQEGWLIRSATGLYRRPEPALSDAAPDFRRRHLEYYDEPIVFRGYFGDNGS